MLNKQEHKVVLDLTRCGFGISQATAQMCELRADKGRGRMVEGKFRTDVGRETIRAWEIF